MATEVKVPELPESVSEATVGEWQKKKGDRVERDENLLDLETDKVVLEVPAAASGVLAEVKVAAGDTVQAGDVLAILEEGEGGAGGDDESEAEDTSSDESEAAESSSDDTDAGDDKPAGSDDAVASPAAKKLMDEHDLAARDVSGRQHTITSSTGTTTHTQPQPQPQHSHAGTTQLRLSLLVVGWVRGNIT